MFPFLDFFLFAKLKVRGFLRILTFTADYARQCHHRFAESRTYIIDQISFHGALLGTFYIESEAKETPSPAADVQCCRSLSMARRTWPKTSTVLSNDVLFQQDWPFLPVLPLHYIQICTSIRVGCRAELLVSQQSVAGSSLAKYSPCSPFLKRCTSRPENYKQPRQKSVVSSLVYT